MDTSELFDGLLENLKVDNRTAIASRRDEIAKSLNKEFRSLDGSTKNQLMVGSYGRGTAIRGISDLDMLYLLPASVWGDYKGESGPARILSRTRKAVLGRYSSTDVKVDQCVVVVQFQNFKFEVQPVFENDDGSFSYPDTYAKSWKVTKPRDEIEAIRAYDGLTRGNLRDLCKMARAWKNDHGVAMGGLLIDTLAYNFFRSTTAYDDVTTITYDYMVRDFFKFLSEEEDQDHYAAMGSGQRVKVKKRFQRRAKKAYELCLEAIEAESKSTMSKKWKAVFGKPVPSSTTVKASREEYLFANTEEFIEDKYPVDVRYELHIDCKVTQDGFRPTGLRKMLLDRVPLRIRKSLDFTIETCDVPEPYVVKWKVLNRGVEAERKDEIRGQIDVPNHGRGRHEVTSFRGDHYVECYVIQGGAIVARDRILVPIKPE
ncbi:nucleotide-binding domain-containing protein [Kocuria arenosa]|uniref:nucleotide-binding domain-containing protein n=1 Tax=Kocuria arenosa TaxID=3071446 RepID=UPI0034D6667A